jgi:molecular chaperone DnaK (HSP70)
MSGKLVVGIDLGTTNCAVASVDPALGAAAEVVDFPVPRVLAPGETGTRPTLPSALYVSAGHELATGAAALPWGDSPDRIVGDFARWQGARVPGRLVVSAKSWLCHPGVDRTAAILPWGAPAEVERMSPVDTSAGILAHIVAAWDHAHPERPLAAQEVVVTVPASFDEVARSLTVEAARRAGLEHFTLLEEPQAAFYDFASRHRQNLAAALGSARLVLVVDVGGGTSDFTLIEVDAGDVGPELRRIAVSDHLMLGGDNMDVALARHAEERLAAGGRRHDAGQWSQLVQAARGAKEALLATEPADTHRVAIAGGGSRLLGGAVSVEFSRDEVERLVLDGFLPGCVSTDQPRRAARTALQELGLPYAQDAGITRHIAAFLRRHAEAGFAALGTTRPDDVLPRPDAVLLNGGVFNSPRLTERLLDVVSAWWPERERIPLLRHDSLDLAVARGAAAYGLARRGLGRRIAGGTAHAIYVGIGAERGGNDRAVCLIPRGHEEGRAVDLDSRPFTLSLGQPVQFPIFSTTADRTDRSGDIVEVDDAFHALPPIHTVFKAASSQARNIPVHLRALLTELGSLELWCVAENGDERWRLEFELRAAVAQTSATVTESMPQRFGEARSIVARVFGGKAQNVAEKEVKNLVRTIEETIGARESWTLPLLREVWNLLLAGAGRRRRSAHHERAFFQLLGFCLRPGFGYPLDEWRCEQTFALFAPLVHHHQETKVWREFWLTWRRIAGGLGPERHVAIWEYLKPHLARRTSSKQLRNPPARKGIQPDGLDEMVRTAAVLEHVPTGEKRVFGNWMLERVLDPESDGGPWGWALGRVGARVPLFGTAHRVLGAEQVEPWVDALLERGLALSDGTAFAAVQLARLTGDRARDLDGDLRARVVSELRRIDAPARWCEAATTVVAMESSDEARSFGDTLPIGLRLR